MKRRVTFWPGREDAGVVIRLFLSSPVNEAPCALGMKYQSADGSRKQQSIAPDFHQVPGRDSLSLALQISGQDVYVSTRVVLASERMSQWGQFSQLDLEKTTLS